MTWIRHIQTRKQSEHLAETEKEGRKVETTEVSRSVDKKTILLLGESRPFFSVTLYARVSGYLTDLLVDIGSVVKKDQLLARVESPETEHAYNSAKAEAMNRRRIAERTRVLLKKKFVSQQEADQAFANADIAEANLKTQATFLSYQKIVAPFDGRIIARFVDPGALIQNASSSQASSQALFTLSQVDRLRIYIYVDQKDAPFVRVGDPVEVSLPSHPESHFSANVSLLAGQLDNRTRTLTVEVQMDNKEGKIVPGSFLQVSIAIQTPSVFTLPSAALVIRDNETFVPVVNPDSKIQYRKIDLLENDGKNILIRSGVQEGERVALNIGNSLNEGQTVRTVPAAGSVAGISAQSSPRPPLKES
jgi:RND family efflux transporter MFP subunit